MGWNLEGLNLVAGWDWKRIDYRIVDADDEHDAHMVNYYYCHPHRLLLDGSVDYWNCNSDSHTLLLDLVHHQVVVCYSSIEATSYHSDSDSDSDSSSCYLFAAFFLILSCGLETKNPLPFFRIDRDGKRTACVYVAGRKDRKRALDGRDKERLYSVAQANDRSVGTSISPFGLPHTLLLSDNDEGILYEIQ